MGSRRQATYAIRLTTEDGNVVKAELVDVGRESGKQAKVIEGNFGRAGRSMEGFSNRVSRLRSGMVALGSVITSIVGAGGFTLLIDRAIDFAEQIGKAADRTGFSTDALQEWRQVAALAGIETQKLDRGFTRFTRSIGEAAQGSGEGLRVFEQLGIAVRDVNGNTRSSEAVFADFRRALEQMESQADASAAASLVFGERVGPQLAVAIRQGSAEIDSQIERIRDLGIVLDEDLIRRSEEARDQIDLLTTALGVNFRAALLETLPVVQDIVAGITDIFIASRGGPTGFAFGDELERIRLEAAIIREEIAELEDRRGGRATAERARLTASLRIRERRDAFLQEQRLLEQIAEQETKIAGIRDRRGIQSRGQENLREKEIKELKDLEEQLIAVRIAIEEAAAPPPAAPPPPATSAAAVSLPTPKPRPGAETFLRNARDELQAVLAATDASIAGFEAQGEAIRQAQALQAQFGLRGKAVFDRTRTSAEQYEAELADLNELLRANVIDTETFERASEQAWRTSLQGSREFKDGAALALIEFGEGATNAAEIARKGVTGAFEGMEDAIAQFAATGKLEISGLVDAAIADFTRLALRTAVFGPIANAFAGIFSPTPTPTGSAGSGPVLAPVLHRGGIPGQDPVPGRAVSAAAFRRAPHFRRGGVANDEFPAILHRGEGVFTPAQMRALGPASAPNVTIINQASDQVRVEAQRGGNPQDLLLFIKRAVADDIVNGGVVGRAFDQSFNAPRRAGLRG